MSDNKDKSKKGEHGHSSASDDDHEKSEPFVPEDSFYDWALVGLSVVAAVGIVGTMGIWMVLPLPNLEGSPTPTVEGGIAKP